MTASAACIGLDADPLAPGLLIPGIIPRVTASAAGPRYLAELLGLCSELRPAALFSTVEHEFPALIGMQRDLAGLGVRTWLPDRDGAQACIDKSAFHAALARNGLPVPRTWLPAEIGQVPDGIPAYLPQPVRARSQGRGPAPLLPGRTRPRRTGRSRRPRGTAAPDPH